MADGKQVIVVTGDIVADHHIYQGERATPHSERDIGTLISAQVGGASLLHRLITQACKDLAASVHLGLQEPNLDLLPPSMHGYALWAAVPSSPGSKDRTWRIDRMLGYGRETDGSATSFPVERSNHPPADIVVIDDAALGFRFLTATNAWPALVQEVSEKTDPALAKRIQAEQQACRWVVMKMSDPLNRGDLYYAASARLKDHLILLISANSIRLQEARVSQAISWERTALDLVAELRTNPALQPLLACRHLVVVFRNEGALLVTDASSENPSFRLIFDAGHMEGEWGQDLQGQMVGFMNCFTAGVVYHLAKSTTETDLEGGVKAGLSAMRALLTSGHGSATAATPDYQYQEIARTIAAPAAAYASTDICAGEACDAEAADRWRIIADGPASETQPLLGTAWRLALFGAKELVSIPFLRLGKLFTVDRREIESLRNLRQLISRHLADRTVSKPLSVAAFGPPGSGKSFSIKQIGKELMGKATEEAILEFNLSQFAGPQDLIGAFHQVRDKVLRGLTPLVFWDEFDSRDYEWLQYFLAPMQDGLFQEGQLTHPIGKCIFVFAGGTSYTYEDFGPRPGPEGQVPKEAEAHFIKCKGPDFRGRIGGYLNVLGPNRRQIYDIKVGAWQDDLTDTCYPVRRSLIIRTALGLGDEEALTIDQGVLFALLTIDRYRHGSRSLESLVRQMQCGPGRSRILRSDLPAAELLDLHVDAKRFLALANPELGFKAKAADLAPHIHEFYRDLCRKNEWSITYDMPFAELPLDIQEDNRAAALRIPAVLALAGLGIREAGSQSKEEASKILQILERYIDVLAEAEHNGWMEFRLQNGWRYGSDRDEKRRIHSALLPYDQLPNQHQEKDRNSVRHYPDILARAGYVVAELSATI